MEIIEKVSAMQKGIFGVEIITETTPSMNKTGNPFVGRVKKVSTYTNAILGVSYQNAVNNRLERKGLENEFEAQAPNGKKHYNAFFYQSLDNTKFYIKVGMYANTSVESYYIIDGLKATAEQVAHLKKFMNTKSNSVQTQAECGLNESEQYHIVSPNADHVVSVSVGERIIYQR